MARWYVLNGPFDGKEAANRGRNLMIGEDGYSPIRLRVARLRDRTGPSVAARLAHLETEHAALVVRVGELERLPEPGPRMSDRAERERLFLLRDRAACGCLFADCTKHGAFYYVTEADRLEAQAIAAEFAGEPAPVPTESAGADGARLSEHRMCSDLAADGMSPFYAANGSRRWMRRNFATPSDIESAPTTAVAYAAMRAAKGAK